MKTIFDIVTSNEIMYAILAMLFFGSCIGLWALNRDKKNTINIIDLISINGILSERKLARFGAWLASSWGFIYLIVNHELSEWYFIGYMSAWVANALIGKALSNTKGEDNEACVENGIGAENGAGEDDHHGRRR